jgi:iron complex transport system ATP-binding protein
MHLLEAEQLGVHIGAVSVCRQLDLHIDTGQRWCILGRNGSGKTTLLHTLAGLHKPDSGSVMVGGKSLDSLQRRTRAQSIGILLQDHSDAFPASVMETVLIGRHPYLGPLQWEGPDDVALARKALRETGLEQMADRNVATLSGGERRRLGIATLLVQDPGLLLLDEPTNHLDIHHQVCMLDLLAGHSNTGDKAMLLVLHDLNLALRYCDHFLLLFGNGETLQGTADEVLTQAVLERLYGHPLQCLQAAQGPVWLPK